MDVTFKPFSKGASTGFGFPSLICGVFKRLNCLRFVFFFTILRIDDRQITKNKMQCYATENLLKEDFKLHRSSTKRYRESTTDKISNTSSFQMHGFSLKNGALKITGVFFLPIPYFSHLVKVSQVASLCTTSIVSKHYGI